MRVVPWSGRRFHVRAVGNNAVLIDSRGTMVYIDDFLLHNELLLIPNWEPGRVSAYGLPWRSR